MLLLRLCALSACFRFIFSVSNVLFHQGVVGSLGLCLVSGKAEFAAWVMASVRFLAQLVVLQSVIVCVSIFSSSFVIFPNLLLLGAMLGESGGYLLASV